MNTIEARTIADQILLLERGALDRWGQGDPVGFLELYAPDITYFDPVTAARIDGHQAMENYYHPWAGKIRIARYEMLNPQVVVDGNMALLTYNLVTGQSYSIKPGTLYALDKHDRHRLRVKTRMRVICTFVPPLVGGEIHDAEGSYPRDE